MHQSISNEDVWVTNNRMLYVSFKVKLVLKFNHNNCIWDFSKWPIKGCFCQWEVDTTVLREWPIRGRFCQWEGDKTVLRELVYLSVLVCLDSWNLFENLLTKIAFSIFAHERVMFERVANKRTNIGKQLKIRTELSRFK